jgi:hypothetical protein
MDLAKQAPPGVQAAIRLMRVVVDGGDIAASVKRVQGMLEESKDLRLARRIAESSGDRAV